MTFKEYPEGKIFYKLTPGQNADDRKLPAIVFAHAAIADHTLWNDQVDEISRKGCTCVQYDLFGFGSSEASETYLQSDPRPAIDHVKHMADLIKEVSKPTHKVIVVGVSMGGMFALRTACMHPELVGGVVSVASGVPGYDAEFDPKEMELDSEIEAAIEEGDAERAAKLQVHYWGDGPLQEQGRCDPAVRAKMYEWCLDVAKRQHAGTGGFAFPTIKRDPITSDQLKNLNMPFAVAIGKFDESSTNTSQKYLAATVRDAQLGTFDTAHLVNLESPEAFNKWLCSWVEAKF